MSAPYDRPAHGEPGGCECFDCGVIFIGAPWHTQCAVCAAPAGVTRMGRDAEGGLVGEADSTRSDEVGGAQ